MKAFKIVFSLLFAFALVVTSRVTSTLAAGGGVTGWLPMLPTHLSDAPEPVQARDQFHLMLPQLLQAKREGRILDFAPDFGDGVLRVTYPTGIVPASMFGRTVFSNIRDAVRSSNFAASLPHIQPEAISISPQAASNRSLILVFNYNPCFVVDANDNSGKAIPEAVVTATLQDASGNLLDTEGGTASSSGFLELCFGSQNSINIIPGMQLEVSIYDPSDSSTTTVFCSTVPYILFSSLNMKAGILGVQTNFATPLGGTKFQLPQLDHQFRNAGNTSVWSMPVSSNHNANSTSFTFNFGHPIYGSDYISMQVSDPSGVFVFVQYMYADYVFCIVGDDYCQVFGLPGKTAVIQITHGKTIGQLKGKFDYSVGSLYGDLLDKYGNPVTVSIGDKITATGTNPLIIPGPLSANIDTPTPSKSFSGLMPRNIYFFANAEDRVWDADVHWIGSDGAGNYKANFSTDSSGITFYPGDQAALYLDYYNPITGNSFLFRRFITVP